MAKETKKSLESTVRVEYVDNLKKELNSLDKATEARTFSGTYSLDQGLKMKLSRINQTVTRIYAITQHCVDSIYTSELSWSSCNSDLYFTGYG